MAIDELRWDLSTGTNIQLWFALIRIILELSAPAGRRSIYFDICRLAPEKRYFLFVYWLVRLTLQLLVVTCLEVISYLVDLFDTQSILVFVSVLKNFDLVSLSCLTLVSSRSIISLSSLLCSNTVRLVTIKRLAM